MSRKISLVFLILLTAGLCNAQAFLRTADLFSRPGSPGSLTIDQNHSIDTLLSRYIISNKKLKTADGKQGMKGFRIQVYYSSVRTAHDEANKIMGQVLNKFGNINAYVEFHDPAWYMVRIGNYRTKTEAYKDLMMIKKEFPDAYSVPTTIIFPELIRK
jgi:hypothetical protein